MIQMKRKPPATQRSFANPWGELDYLCKKIRYWMYTRKKKIRAERYLDRLARVLATLPDDDLAILRQEGMALLHELQGEIAESIACRTREIALMQRLHREAQTSNGAASTKAYMLRGRGDRELAERRAVLETLKKRQADPLMSASH